eukprot:Pompholyxophrys_sp_v1_NODE_1_length_32789_cov_6.460653.p11 type:complete len:377 gc:universal NODE_1_length_32789_cov_6.460653:26337-27467(+)
MVINNKKMINKTLQYFDLLTQNTFDIYSHLKFTQAFKGALIGRCNTVLLQYKANTGCMSPGFRFLLRTRPGIIYNITLNGLLHIGGPASDNGAVLFVESINPQYSIVPKDQAFKTGIPNSITLNFRALTNLTVIGILFVSDTISYCLEIDEFRVRKFNETLSEPGNEGGVSDGICQVNTPAQRPVCTIIDPPTIKQILPGSAVLCPDDFAKSILQDETVSGGWTRTDTVLGSSKAYKPKLDFNDDQVSLGMPHTQNVQNGQNQESNRSMHRPMHAPMPSLNTHQFSPQIQPNQNHTQNPIVNQSQDKQEHYDFIGEVLQDVTDTACSVLGKIVLEFNTGKLWICDGKNLLPFECNKPMFVYRDINTGQIIEVEKSD